MTVGAFLIYALVGGLMILSAMCWALFSLIDMVLGDDDD